MAYPQSQRRKVTQVEFVLLALSDTGGCEGDLARHEGFATTLRLMVEKNTRAAEHIVGFAVLLNDPISIELGYGIGAVGMERGFLVLRDLLHLAIKLRGRSLIDAAGLGKSALAYGLKNAQHARSIDVGRELRSIE